MPTSTEKWSHASCFHWTQLCRIVCYRESTVLLNNSAVVVTERKLRISAKDL
jgi:hypothetical protein